MRDKSLLEVSMMLGDAIDKLNALSAYKDPYAHLKEAYAKGEQIQCKEGGVVWKDYHSPLWTYDPSCYRIKPKTKTLYLFAYRDENTKSWKNTDIYHESIIDARADILWAVEFKRLDYTAIEVES